MKEKKHVIINLRSLPGSDIEDDLDFPNQVHVSCSIEAKDVVNAAMDLAEDHDAQLVLSIEDLGFTERISRTKFEKNHILMTGRRSQCGKPLDLSNSTDVSKYQYAWCNMCGFNAYVKPDEVSEAEESACPCCKRHGEQSKLSVEPILPDGISPDWPLLPWKPKGLQVLTPTDQRK